MESGDGSTTGCSLIEDYIDYGVSLYQKNRSLHYTEIPWYFFLCHCSDHQYQYDF